MGFTGVDTAFRIPNPANPLATDYTGVGAVWTAPGAHVDRAQNLMKLAERMQRIGVESYLALYTETHQWNRRRVKVEMPLFPGYVFVRISLAERLRVLNAPGVAYLVNRRGEPVALADHDIEPLRDCLSQKLQVEPFAYLNAGSRVRVVAGPLSGLEGVIVRRESGARFVVSIDLIMRAIAINVEGLDLELIESGSTPVLNAVYGEQR